jgi:hypothetical protein
MHVHKITTLTTLAVVGCTAAALMAGSTAPRAMGAVAPSEAKATAALVSVDGPITPFQQNAQVQPALAVDPIQPNIVASTAYDSIDTQPCSKKASITAAACQLPATAETGGLSNPGVGLTGMYFSFDSGHHWVQPTYRGLTAAGCSATVIRCKVRRGPIHTVPNYYEHGLGSFGDSSVAFGPVWRNGKFSWGNGSRLYVSNVATNLHQTVIRPGSINTTSTMAVSHIDDPTAARVDNQSNWSAPVIVPKREPAISFATEDQIWADNVSSSPYFGNVYMCYNDFYFEPSGNVPLFPTVAVSTDGGQSWTIHRVGRPIDSAAKGYREGCAIRTDSHGEVYAVFSHLYGSAFPSDHLAATEDLFTSQNGGATWAKPVDIMHVNTGCYYFDPVADRCAEDGPGGSPAEPAPSLDIANGAPSGANATNELVFAWSDGRFGLNHEAAMLSYSTDQAKTWSAPATVSLPSDRSVLAAAAIAPDGTRVYMTYTALTTPFSATLTAPRLEHGVLRSAPLSPSGSPGPWVTDYVGPTGDVRGTGQGGYNYEEFTGFYIDTVATRSYGIGAWTDFRHTAACPAMDAWREKSLEALTVVTPTPWPLAACPANFGNSKIWSATTAP